MSEIVARIQPDAVFCPHPFEGWSDHIAAEEMARAALAEVGGQRSGAVGGQTVGRSGRWSPERVELYHYCVWFWFSMPLRKAFRVDWRNAVALDIRPVWHLKQKAIQTYLEDLAPCGKPTCGVLPKDFLRAFNWKKELFFRVPGFGR
jgi:N-acetylglucosamine malate deacetylase 1